MIVSQPALLCLTSFWNNLTGRASVSEVHAEPVPKPASPPPAVVERAASIRNARLKYSVQDATVQPEPLAITGATISAAAARTADDPSVAATVEQASLAGTGPLTANERRARAAALRALAFSRARRFDAAQTAFEDAATLDPALDLTRVPAFWSLERAAHEAAISAYVAAGRTGDAAVLRAKVQSVYRPKPLRTRNVPATT